MSARWYKRCGADFIHGTMMLTLEEKGAYSLCLDLIYDRGGPIPDDARWLSGVCGVSLRKWAALRDRLLSLGKLVSDGEYLSNARAALEIVSAEKYARNQAESGAKGGRKRAENAGQSLENSDLDQATLKPTEKIREDKKIIEEVEASPPAIAQPITEAVDIWNEAAGAVGWPVIRRISDPRRKALNNRLKAEGVDGWQAAIVRARASPYLGSDPPAWFTFDWIIQAANFLKLIEGNYDRNRHQSSNGQPQQIANTRLRAAVELDAERNGGIGRATW